MATVLEVRQALIDRGYVPIPVIGKAPPFKLWQKIENVSRSMLEAWGRNWPRASNTGILTKHTPTLDADILNEPAAIAVEELVRVRFEERGCILPPYRQGAEARDSVPHRGPVRQDHRQPDRRRRQHRRENRIHVRRPASRGRRHSSGHRQALRVAAR
jgi:Bifunctional DNA primase/polymerase, N-terminal